MTDGGQGGWGARRNKRRERSNESGESKEKNEIKRRSCSGGNTNEKRQSNVAKEGNPLLPEMLEEDPLAPLLDERAAPRSWSWSTWMVLGLGRVDREAEPGPTPIEDLSLGTGRALTGSGMRP